MNGMQKTAAGAAGGVAGALGMTIFRQTMQEVNLGDTPFPLKIERRLENRLGLGRKTDQKEEVWLAAIEHLALGAGIGLLYPLFRSEIRLPLFAGGLLFGVIAWAIYVAGIGPALHLSSPLHEQSRLKFIRRFAAHLIYGVVTASVTEMLIKSSRE